MKLLFFLTFFMILSCLSSPEIYLSTKNANYWIENVRNKITVDSYENLYKFNDNADLTLSVYGYNKPIKYKLFLMKEKNQSFYYKNITLKNYIIESLPNLNLYSDMIKKNAFETLYLDSFYYVSKNFPDKSIYLSIGLMIENNILYLASHYNKEYEDRLNFWLRKNGYGNGKDWTPSISANWESYPVPTEHEVDWDKIEIIGELL